MEFNVFEVGFVTKKIEFFQEMVKELIKKITGEDIKTKDNKHTTSSLKSNKKADNIIKHTNETNSGIHSNTTNCNNSLNSSISAINNINSVRMLRSQQTRMYVREEDADEDDASMCACNNHMDISTAHLVLSYMEKYRTNLDLLADEWRGLLSYQPDDTNTSVAMQTHNTHKNRNLQTVPYDKNRVRLERRNNNKHNDYINASYIVDNHPQRPTYIFTQNPIPSTTSDFWQMVWETGSNAIINLTSLSDQSHPYWPQTGSCTYHNYEVHLISQHITHPDYIIRNLLVYNLNNNNKNNKNNNNENDCMDCHTDYNNNNNNDNNKNTNNNNNNKNNNKNNKTNNNNSNNTNNNTNSNTNNNTTNINNNNNTNNTNNNTNTNKNTNNNNNANNNNTNNTNNTSRTISILHYHSWQSSQTPPSIDSFLSFMRKVSKHGGGRRKLIVHCSDGSDRTGTYALIDIVIQRITSGVKEIDIAATLEHLRDQRMGVVKSKDQFEFSLRTVAHHISLSLTKACP